MPLELDVETVFIHVCVFTYYSLYICYQVITDFHLRKLIYCDFANPKVDTRFYMETSNFDHLSSTVEAFLVEFNNMSKKPMNLVLFR